MSGYHYTSSPLLTWPAAHADGVTVTPSGVAEQYTDWVEIAATVATDARLASVIAFPGWRQEGNFWEVQVGIGATMGVVVAKHTERGLASGSVTGDDEGTDVADALPLAIPCDVIPAGSKVWVRLRTTSTNTTDWKIAVQYYALPITGNMPAASVGAVAVPAGSRLSVTPINVAWTWSSWVEVGVADDDWTIAKVLVMGQRATYWEIEIGIGPTIGAVEAKTRVRGATDWFFAGGQWPGGPWTRPLKPCFGGVIESGDRVWFRQRSNGTSTTAWKVGFLVYKEWVTGAQSRLPQKWFPTGADSQTVVGAYGTFGAWTEFIAETTDDFTLTGLTMTLGNLGACIVQIGLGAEDEEVEKITRVFGNGVQVGGGRFWLDFGHGFDVPVGSRISLRMQHGNPLGGSVAFSIGYFEDADFDNRSDYEQFAAQATLASATAAGWGPGTWREFLGAQETDSLIISYRSGAGLLASQEFEVEIGLGEPGVQEPIDCIREACATSGSGGGDSSQMLPTPRFIPAGNRMWYRSRGADTSSGTNPWFFWMAAPPLPPGTARFTLEEAWAGSTGPLFWTTLAHRDTDGTVKRFPWAPISIADPAEYQDGYKEGRLLSVGEISCPLSDRTGRLQVPTCDVTYSDLPDRDGLMLLRGMLGRDAQKALRGKEFTIYAITDRDRRRQITPVIVFRGYVDRCGGPADYEFQIFAKGWIAKRLTQRLWPGTIATLFNEAPPETRQIALPVAFGLQSDEGSETPGVVFVLDEAGRGGSVTPITNPQGSYGSIGVAAPTGVMLGELPGMGSIPAGTYHGFVTRVVDGVEGDPTPFLPEDAYPITVSDDAAIEMICAADGADAYRFYLASGTYQYIETTDPATGVIFDAVPTATGAVGGVALYAFVAVTAMMPDGRTARAPAIPPVPPDQLAFVQTLGYRRPVRLAWEPIVGAEYYEVWFRFYAWYDKKFILPADQLNLDGNVYWEYAWGSTGYEPIAFEDVPSPQGIVPAIHVGKFTDITGWPDWDGFLVSARPCVEIENCYLGGTLIVESQYGVDALARGKPGFATYFADAPYAVGDHLVELVFLRGPLRDRALGLLDTPQEVLKVNVKGVSVLGDADACETSIYEIFRRLAKNCILPDEPAITGAFNQDPEFSDGAQRLDDDSVDQAAEDGLAVIPAGPTAGRWLFGDMTVGDLLQDICPSGKMKVGIKPSGQMIVCVHNPEAEVVAAFSEGMEIIDRSFEFECTDQGFANRVTAHFEPVIDVDGDVTLARTETVDDTLSQSAAQYDEVVADSEDLNLTWRRSAGAARQLARAFLKESAYLPQPAKAASVMHWVHRSPGEVISVTHRQGATATGYSDRKHAILGLSIALSEFKVSATLLDLRRRVGDISDFLARLFMGIQELGGSRLDSCLTEDGTVVPPNYKRGIVNWDQVPTTHEIVFDVEAQTDAGTVTPGLFEYGTDVAVVDTTPANSAIAASTMTRQQVVVDRPDEGGVVEYWMLPVLAGGATADGTRLMGRLRIREIGSEV